jgi:IMP dehydrogenase
MTKDNLVTIPVGTTLDEAEKILETLHQLLVVDQDFNLKASSPLRHSEKLEYPAPQG